MFSISLLVQYLTHRAGIVITIAHYSEQHWEHTPPLIQLLIPGAYYSDAISQVASKPLNYE